MNKEIIQFIKSQYPGKEFIPLHEPVFRGNEKKYLAECIDTTYVSSVGSFVNRFEEMMAEITGVSHAVAAVNGTAALHMALIIADVKPNDLVITQPLSFVATSNAISYQFAQPVFVDVDKETLGMSPEALQTFLEKNCEVLNNQCVFKTTGQVIKACVPMHTFGHSCRIDEIFTICKQWSITLVEDAAESIGSYYNGKHTGSFGPIGAVSFNGNKTVTSGGGGAILFNDPILAKKAKHLTTQAKVPHSWNFYHDHVGYNYRLPNLNAALAVAQLEQLNGFVENKRELADIYRKFFDGIGIEFMKEPEGARSNYWLNCIFLEDRTKRDAFLKESNEAGVMTRPVWDLIQTLPPFKNCICGPLPNSEWIADRLVNIPSSVRI